jgi:tetratricopeptide (TPR) repeat protein
MESYKTALEYNRENPFAYYNRALIHYASNQFQKAKGDLRQALKINSGMKKAERLLKLINSEIDVPK